MKLPEPQRDLEFPLMRALAERRTKRRWRESPVSMQDLSNLLWAACGITQPKTRRTKSKRTAPSACNAQEIRVFVAMADGVYSYEDEKHVLTKVTGEDVRAIIGTQKMMQSAPLGLVFVADLSRMTGPYLRTMEAKRFSAWVDTGFISQNIYLYCAAAGLATAVLALINREKLGEHLKLGDHEKIVLTQVVGYQV
jgi:SagB-type dehydrogenase family enzyme